MLTEFDLPLDCFSCDLFIDKKCTATSVQQMIERCVGNTPEYIAYINSK